MSTTLLKSYLTDTPAITPSQLTANTNDWLPAAMSGAGVIRVSTDASRNLTGLQDGRAGRSIILMNIGSSNLVLKHDTTSSAANRFYCPKGLDFTLGPNCAILLIYDVTSSRWRVYGTGIDVTQINATGTPNSGTFLRGDGSWAALSTDFVKIASVSNYSVTNIDFTGLDFSYASPFAGYLWVIDELILPGNTDLHMLASTDNGSNWLGGTNYWYWANDLNGVNTNSTGAAQIRLSPWTLAGSVNGGSANGSTQGRIFMPCGSVTGMRYHTGITDFMMPKNADGNYLQVRGGFCIKAIDNGPPVNAIRLKCSSGDTSAHKITLYGLKR